MDVPDLSDNAIPGSGPICPKCGSNGYMVSNGDGPPHFVCLECDKTEVTETRH